MDGASIFLSFDDAWVDVWRAFLPVFAAFDILATFYVSLRFPPCMDIVSAEEAARALPEAFWEGLGAIADAGHVIGYHTVNHQNAAYQYPQTGMARYLAEEIDAGLSVFAANGFRPAHFAYPFGKHDDALDAALLERFATLRVAQLEGEAFATYGAGDLKRTRVFDAPDIADPRTGDNINAALDAGRSIFLHGHRPDHPSDRIRQIVAAAKRSRARFATVEELA